MTGDAQPPGRPLRGSCHCAGVVFEVTPPLRDVIACHCTQCRKTSGHYWVASSVPLDRFRLLRETGLAWFRSSAAARRGFCRCCGASLFWQPDGEARISFSPAALEGPTGLVLAGHIFTADAGDYYAPEGPPPAARAAPARLSASCLCGGVRFSLPGPAGPVIACHCDQCRRISGHFSASFDAGESTVAFAARSTLAEYATPGGARRGFCAACGSSLWFRAADGSFAVEAGAVDGPTGGRLAGHVFAAGRADYHRIDDGLPQAAGPG
jgi:hypothetical protein